LAKKKFRESKKERKKERMKEKFEIQNIPNILVIKTLF
jgi:hypothetical protein